MFSQAFSPSLCTTVGCADELTEKKLSLPGRRLSSNAADVDKAFGAHPWQVGEKVTLAFTPSSSGPSKSTLTSSSSSSSSSSSASSSTPSSSSTQTQTIKVRQKVKRGNQMRKAILFSIKPPFWDKIEKKVDAYFCFSCP